MASQVQYNGLMNVTLAINTYASAPKFVQWGTGTGAARSANAVTAGNTTEARVSGTISCTTTSQTLDTWQVVGTVTANAVHAITEVGLFDAAGSGNPPTGANMCMYSDFTSIGVASADSIQFTIKTQFT